MRELTWRQLERQTHHALEAHGAGASARAPREIQGWDQLKRWAPKKHPAAKA